MPTLFGGLSVVLVAIDVVLESDSDIMLIETSFEDIWLGIWESDRVIIIVLVGTGFEDTLFGIWESDTAHIVVENVAVDWSAVCVDVNKVVLL